MGFSNVNLAAAPVAIQEMAQELVVVDNLTVSLAVGRNRFNVVEQVGFSIAPGEMLGLVGESGSGKSVTGAAICKLLPRVMKQESGQIRVAGIEISALSEREMARYRGSLVSVVPQDPTTSLDPCFTIGHQIMDVLRAHGRSRREAREQALEKLRQVRISDPERRFNQYPHEVSGGMRQRVLIAMAISCGPRLLIADECTTALDATTQAQILELLRSLSVELRMATIFTTHDLGVAREMCSRVAVMYAGQIIEFGDLATVFERPRHPYTERLLASVPSRAHGLLSRGIPGRVPPLVNLPAGCRFHPRCEHAVAGLCTQGAIAPVRVGNHMVRCVRQDELRLEGVRA
jgi:oligopeptide/dipeptide ABC transporter ATP-binding protein